MTADDSAVPDEPPDRQAEEPTANEPDAPESPTAEPVAAEPIAARPAADQAGDADEPSATAAERADTAGMADDRSADPTTDEAAEGQAAEASESVDSPATDAEAHTGTAAEADTAADAEAHAGTAAEADTAAAAVAAKPTRRPHMLVRFAVALITGALVGAGTGYGVQDSRQPTPLPSLAQPAPAQPRLAAGATIPPLPASEDDLVKINSGLGALLLPDPPGAIDGTDQHGGTYLSLLDYALCCYSGSAVAAFKSENSDGVQSAVQRLWRRDDLWIDIQLVSYSGRPLVTDGKPDGPYDAAGEPGVANPQGVTGSPSTTPIPGTLDGQVSVWSQQQPASDGGAYSAAAVAQHGSVDMYIWVTSPNPVSAAMVMPLATAQLGRL